MVALLAIPFLAALCAPTLVSRWGRNALYLLSAAPAFTAIYALFQTRAAFEAPREQLVTWVPSLDLNIVLRIDPLTWLMLLIVGGVGALVMVYSARYFSADSSGLARFASLFLAFSGAMTGVVLADQTLTLYVFWELTSVLSYLLIGFHHHRQPARSAARQALLVTGAGALAMFAGLVLLGEAPGGSYRISALIAALQTGLLQPSPLVITAAILVLAGALTKSAQVPFHFWLPGAMAAPTPVSAYLHAAAMVKAGVYLVARMTPGFYLIPGWSQLAVTFGLATMLVGSYRALSQRDLKLVLAYGTVSQLGLMTAAVGLGSASAMAAGLVILAAHSLFKSALFLTVGAVESSTGTRDLWELSGLGRKTPALAVFAGVAALSMAGIPVTTGYLGKEGFISALVHGTDANWLGREAGWALLVLVVLGAAMTFAYAWRFWWGAFATKRIKTDREATPVPASMLIPIGVLASGAVLGVCVGPFQTLGDATTSGLPGHAHISLWSGPWPALATALALVLGFVLIWQRVKVHRAQRAMHVELSAVRVYSRMLRSLEARATLLTARMQRGSLPSELATIFAVAAAAIGAAFLVAPLPETAPALWDSLLQLGIVAATFLATMVTLTARRRIKAALALGAVGLLISLLFAQYGAPDLALTQLAVEAVSIVVFVLVLRRLPRDFSPRRLRSQRIARAFLAVAVGVGVAFGGYLAFGARVHPPVSTDMPAESVSFGYGSNIVNVILVDMRAWDTVGELSVLLVTATGVASLIYVVGRAGKISRPDPARRGAFIAAARMVDSRQRSTVLEVSTRILFPTMMVLSVWLLMVGHNNPGGGFAGGVVAGLAFTLRYLAGGRFELGEAMPIPAGYLMGGGLFVAAAGGALPLLYGNAVLQSVPVHLPLGALGELHFTTALILDVGVYVLVIGLVLDLISALGAEIDRQLARDEVSA